MPAPVDPPSGGEGANSASRRGLWRKHSASVVAATYGITGVLWIALSDQVASWLAPNADALTHIQTWKGWAFISMTTVMIFLLVRYAVSQMQIARRELDVSDERYRAMIETTNEGVWVVNAEGRGEYVNHTLITMLGVAQQELIGRDCRVFAGASCQDAMNRAIAPRGDGAQRFDCEFARADGSGLWAIVSASPIPPTHNRPAGTLLMLTDITARKTAEQALERNLEMQRGLLNELDHRVRNNLSSLASLIDLSRSATGSVDEFAAVMGGRVQAMATAHALAGQSGPDGIELERILAEMAPTAGRDRVEIDGPRFAVTAAQIVPTSMLFHELFAHSARDGALATSNGRLRVTWSVDGLHDRGRTVVLRWEESPRGGDDARAQRG